MDDYTTEFHQLLARNDLAETEEQLVSYYIGGLRPQFQDTLNLFDLYSISDAHQRALQLEEESNCRYGPSNWSTTNQTGTNTQLDKVVNTQAVTIKPAGTQFKPGTLTFDFKCYKCGEPGYRVVECRKRERQGKN